MSTNLVGTHQTNNAALAYEITHYLGVPDEVIIEGLQQVSHPGRLEYITPNLLIDGAHNEQ
jgi:dihydrofolate synthase/folylpolyglutamate synthase